jgi:hypothetical protein
VKGWSIEGEKKKENEVSRHCNVKKNKKSSKKHTLRTFYIEKYRGYFELPFIRQRLHVSSDSIFVQTEQ